MDKTKGRLSIHAKTYAIIKIWLYSDKDISSGLVATAASSHQIRGPDRDRENLRVDNLGGREKALLRLR
jgi:hypothetical protein